MANKPMFEVVEDEPDTPPKAPAADRAGLSMLTLGLKTLSDRAKIALGNLFTLATVCLAFWLFFAIKDSPTVYQLVLAAMCATFMLIINWIVRR